MGPTQLWLCACVSGGRFQSYNGDDDVVTRDWLVARVCVGERTASAKRNCQNNPQQTGWRMWMCACWWSPDGRKKKSPQQRRLSRQKQEKYKIQHTVARLDLDEGWSTDCDVCGNGTNSRRKNGKYCTTTATTTKKVLWKRSFSCNGLFFDSGEDYSVI